jgi:hypothetical protein
MVLRGGESALRSLRCPHAVLHGAGMAAVITDELNILHQTISLPVRRFTPAAPTEIEVEQVDMVPGVFMFLSGPLVHVY